METDAGKGYLKALGGPEGPHTLACEWVATQLARWFGLSTFDFAILLNAQNRREEAAAELIEIIKFDRAWNDDGARKQLLQFFDAWGAVDPATISARRKLSALLFS